MNLNCLVFFPCIGFVDTEYYRTSIRRLFTDHFLKIFIAGHKPGCKNEMANVSILSS